MSAPESLGLTNLGSRKYQSFTFYTEFCKRAAKKKMSDVGTTIFGTSFAHCSYNFNYLYNLLQAGPTTLCSSVKVVPPIQKMFKGCFRKNMVPHVGTRIIGTNSYGK